VSPLRLRSDEKLRGKTLVARSVLADKIARAVYYALKRQSAFEVAPREPAPRLIPVGCGIATLLERNHLAWRFAADPPGPVAGSVAT
jgi:hypothetical protein